MGTSDPTETPPVTTNWAKITVIPSERPVTRLSVSIVATPSSSVLQVAEEVRSEIVPSEKVPVVVISRVSPQTMVLVAGETARSVSRSRFGAPLSVPPFSPPSVVPIPPSSAQDQSKIRPIRPPSRQSDGRFPTPGYQLFVFALRLQNRGQNSLFALVSAKNYTQKFS